MRAFVLEAHGELDRTSLAELPRPATPGPRHVTVALRAAALNHLDLWTVRGLPGLSLTFPHVLGGDGAGVIEAVGSEVRTVEVGDKVMINPGVACHSCDYCLSGRHSLCPGYRLLGEHVPGTLTEAIVLPETNVVRVPALSPEHPPLTWAEAAAFSLVTLTAWHMLVDRARVRAGETVLIWGIGGGVSGAALKVAKLHGAVVVATSSSERKLAWAREHGADVVLNHATGDVAKEVRRLTAKRGVDIVVENVGEATWDASLRMLGRGGRLVTCGATSGPNVTIDIRRLFWYQWDILGSTMGGDAAYRAAVRALATGGLRPTVDSITPLAEARDAFRHLEAGGQLGKLVVEISGDASAPVYDR